MEIINVEQRKPEWHEIRKGKMTASHAVTIKANGKGLQTYIHEIMAGYYSKAITENYTNEAMERGVELESKARFVYECESGNTVEEVGFVVMNKYVGASPDGFAGDGLVEIKCPQDKEYFRMLLGGDIKPEYVAQMQMQMMVCEKSWCDFVAYSPNFETEMIIRRVEIDEGIIQKLDAGIRSGIGMIEVIKTKIKENHGK